MRLLFQSLQPLSQCLVLLAVGDDLPLQDTNLAAVLQQPALVLVLGLDVRLPLALKMVSHLLSRAEVLNSGLLLPRPQDGSLFFVLCPQVLDPLLLLLLQPMLLIPVGTSLVGKFQLGLLDATTHLHQQLRQLRLLRVEGLRGVGGRPLFREALRVQAGDVCPRLLQLLPQRGLGLAKHAVVGLQLLLPETEDLKAVQLLLQAVVGALQLCLFAFNLLVEGITFLLCSG
mmetsp:Transcript_137076/g.324760  ORF Transcript_137076/g.324760 Transcript_137076/m.324760 type:complete len:229 (-) Transcript_137076:1111-1797(-)